MQHDFDTLLRERQGIERARSSALLGLIVVFLLAAMVWAARTELDTVTRATGRIVPSSQIQIIQATEPGILQRLHVEEGDIVEAGQLLVSLKGQEQVSARDQEQQRVYALMARIARLEAEVNEARLDFDAELAIQAAALVAAETTLFQARRRELAAELEVLAHQRGQREAQIAMAESELATAHDMLAIVAEERAILEPLARAQLVARPVLLETQRRESDWRGRAGLAQASLARAQIALAEIEAQTSALTARYHASALADLSRAHADLAALAPGLPALQDRAARIALHAPLRGVVNRIHSAAIGAPVRAGDELIELVPLDDTLLVEAFLRPADIGFILPGQSALVTISAFDALRYGRLTGEIIRVSASATPRSARDPQEGFMVQLRLDGALEDAKGRAVVILPGMEAEIDILAEPKTVLSYLTTPLTRMSQRALRE